MAQEPDETPGSRIDPGLGRAIEAVERAMGSVRRVIEISDTQLSDPGHAETAQDRIVLAEREMGILEAELVALRAGDLEMAGELHREWQALRLSSERQAQGSCPTPPADRAT